MKTPRIPFIVAILFVSIVSFSQEEIIKLNVEEGYEYIYDLTEKEYVQKENGEDGQTTLHKKQLKVITEEVIPGKSIKVRVNITENYEEVIYNKWRQRTDFIYRDLRDLRYYTVINPQSFISSTDLIFQINLTNRNIELVNRAELLEKYHGNLSEDKVESKEKLINLFNTNFLGKIPELLDFMLWFHNSQITADGRIKNSTLEDKLILKDKSSKQFNLITGEDSILKPGREYKHFSINLENGLLMDYRYLKKDSIQNKYGQNVGEFLYNATEKEYRLLSGKKIHEGPVIVKGRIVNPLSDKLYFRYLDEPFGVDFKKELVYLDDKGNFEVELNLKHAGFVFVENQNPNRHKPTASYVLYADKGDIISFNHNSNHPEKPIEFGGAKTMENELLNKVNKEFNIFNSGEYFDRLNDAIYDPRNFVARLQTQKITVSEFINELWTEYELASTMVSESENKLSYLGFQYIRNELKSYYYGHFFQYLSLANVIEGKDKFLLQIPQAIQQELEFQNLHSFYNDYGYYSRNCVRQYTRYKYHAVSQINNPGFVFRSSLMPDLNQHVQFSRMLLSGSPFYRDIAAILEEFFMHNIFLPWNDYDGHILDNAVEYMNLIETNCFDKEIVEKVQAILRQYNQLQNKDPEIKELEVFDADGKLLQLGEILQNKTTVVLFASDLMRWSISFDRLAGEYPEISFLRVAQSSNQKEWQKYKDITESTVSTYLYLNDSIGLEDIFLKAKVLAVFNKHGELIHYTSNHISAAKLAKQSLEQKKELDKSQLQTIVIILLMLLILFSIGLIIWKWRVRQRFRKEEQQRRLRELELTAIRSQMNPHFLFNSLNSVQNLVQQNKGREAHLYLSDFAGLIRKVLQNSEKEEVSLAEELEMVQQYLNLEKLRFNFDYTIKVDDKIEKYSTVVPSNILQPIVENAIVHGLNHKSDNRVVKINVLPDNRGLKIIVEDNGIGRVAAAELSETKNGKGLKLVEERLNVLQQKQGERYQIEITDFMEDKTGTRVEILIPDDN